MPAIPPQLCSSNPHAVCTAIASARYKCDTTKHTAQNQPHGDWGLQHRFPSVPSVPLHFAFTSLQALACNTRNYIPHAAFVVATGMKRGAVSTVSLAPKKNTGHDLIFFNAAPHLLTICTARVLLTWLILRCRKRGETFRPPRQHVYSRQRK